MRAHEGDVVGEGNVPIFVAKEGVKLAQNWFVLFVAPSEFAVLEVDFFKIASIKRVSKSNNLTPVYISTIFVSSPVDLVKVTGYKPSCSNRRLRSNQLSVEYFL
jgi:hypothetical protein